MGVDQEQLWVLQAQRGNEEAFARLIEAYQAPIYNLAYRMLGSSGEAEDAAQETFLRVYTRLHTYEPERKFSSWILSIASHYCIDRLRRRRGNVASLDEMQSANWVPDDAPKPEERALDSEQSVVISQMLGCLPEQYRVVIVLRYWHDMGYDEIAEVTQSTESAVKSRLHRAREMMAAKMQEREMAKKEKNPNPRRVPENALSRSF